MSELEAFLRKGEAIDRLTPSGEIVKEDKQTRKRGRPRGSKNKVKRKTTLKPFDPLAVPVEESSLNPDVARLSSKLIKKPKLEDIVQKEPEDKEVSFKEFADKVEQREDPSFQPRLDRFQSIPKIQPIKTNSLYQNAINYYKVNNPIFNISSYLSNEQIEALQQSRDLLEDEMMSEECISKIYDVIENNTSGDIICTGSIYSELPIYLKQRPLSGKRDLSVYQPNKISYDYIKSLNVSRNIFNNKLSFIPTRGVMYINTSHVPDRAGVYKNISNSSRANDLIIATYLALGNTVEQFWSNSGRIYEAPESTELTPVLETPRSLSTPSKPSRPSPFPDLPAMAMAQPIKDIKETLVKFDISTNLPDNLKVGDFIVMAESGTFDGKPIREIKRIEKPNIIAYDIVNNKQEKLSTKSHTRGVPIFKQDGRYQIKLSAIEPNTPSYNYQQLYDEMKDGIIDTESDEGEQMSGSGVLTRGVFQRESDDFLPLKEIKKVTECKGGLNIYHLRFR